MMASGYNRSWACLARLSDDPNESETQDLRTRMREESGRGRSPAKKRQERPAGGKYRRAPSGGNGKVCPNCGRIFGKGYRKCWYCKWEPWYIRYWYITVAVLAVLGLLLTVLLFRK